MLPFPAVIIGTDILRQSGIVRRVPAILIFPSQRDSLADSVVARYRVAAAEPRVTFARGY